MTRTFLIADDSLSKTMLLQGILHAVKWDGQILLAKTTEEAKRLIDEAEGIDAAFIDYYMPSERGPAVIAYLRAKFPSAKIALVSSADDAENAQEAMDAGADAVICSTLADSEERLKDAVQTWRMEWVA